jgi:hypothetical protein
MMMSGGKRRRERRSTSRSRSRGTSTKNSKTLYSQEIKCKILNR